FAQVSARMLIGQQTLANSRPLALDVQRSQVQILPPLQTNTATAVLCVSPPGSPGGLSSFPGRIEPAADGPVALAAAGALPEVDQFSAYRRYAPSQRECARLVATLRLLAMPLARIKQV